MQNCIVIPNSLKWAKIQETCYRQKTKRIFIFSDFALFTIFFAFYFLSGHYFSSPFQTIWNQQKILRFLISHTEIFQSYLYSLQSQS
jgi:hypothetical protein